MYKERIATVAERLNQAMRLRDMRQIDLCRICKIPKGAMSLYISGAYEPKQDRLQLLAEALSVDIAWLMGYDTPISPNETTISPDLELTEGERMLVELFRQIPAEQQKRFLEMGRLFADSLKTN